MATFFCPWTRKKMLIRSWRRLMAFLHSRSASMGSTWFLELSNSFGSFAEWSSLSTRRSFIGASSLPSSCRTVKS